MAYPNLALNQLLQQKTKLNMQGSIKWKTFLFPPISEIKSFEGITQQYFGLDLIIEDNEKTHWTHKPGV